MAFHRWSVFTSLGDEPPGEFRIFKRGVNQSKKGSFLFDEEAARTVMAAYQEWGVDLIVDLNHDSLDADSKSRADASDARAHFGLELRGGELWGVNVRWTADGERRLREKTQRYISPAFDTVDGRITELFNAALVSMPATCQAPGLVAANRGIRSKRLDTVEAAARYLADVKKDKRHGSG